MDGGRVLEHFMLNCVPHTVVHPLTLYWIGLDWIALDCTGVPNEVVG